MAGKTIGFSGINAPLVFGLFGENGARRAGGQGLQLVAAREIIGQAARKEQMAISCCVWVAETK